MVVAHGPHADDNEEDAAEKYWAKATEKAAKYRSKFTSHLLLTDANAQLGMYRCTFSYLPRSAKMCGPRVWCCGTRVYGAVPA